MGYTPNETRYQHMKYNAVGRSGLKLPSVSLGLWHNFGNGTAYDSSRNLVLGSFDMGITHFDIANNYGPPPGAAEKTFGRILKEDLADYRDELIVSSKAGYYMWSGPYGEWGSKKSLVTSIDQSLKRTGLDYFDIFYHHRPDPNTPIEETMDALKHIVKSGKALYAGISNYNAAQADTALATAKGMKLKILIHQVNYSMFNREMPEALFPVLEKHGTGAIAFSCLAQGLLSTKYFDGIPQNSRAAGASVFLTPESITPEKVEMAKKLNAIAQERGQTLSQMALAWVMRQECIASVLVGASSFAQIAENVQFMAKASFSQDELAAIDNILKVTK